MLKKMISVILCLSVLCSSALFLNSCGSESKKPSESSAQKTEEKTTSSGKKDTIKAGTILHCFSWDFETITNSLDDIAAAGFTSIQTSPINECLRGEDGGMQLYGKGKWYYHYQPTDWTIGNYQLGTRDEFKTMCDKAEELGISVIVDVAPNHTTPTTSAINENLINAVGGIDNLFHKGSEKDITDWGDRLQCTTYKMGGLPDVDTENKDFQDYFIAYINDCIDCGADGFRYDTAKHIGLPDDPKDPKDKKNNFWTRVIKEIHNADDIFNYGEVLQGNNDRITDYIKTIGASTASTYGGTLRNAVNSGNVVDAALTDLRVGDDPSVVTWVESHDNYINDGNWSAMEDEQVLLGWAIIAARAKGTPLFFDRPYGNTYEEQWGTMNRIGASGNMFYKDKSVVAVNHFRKAMTGEDESFINPGDDTTAIQICRGNKGAVIVNTWDDLKTGFETELADGTYIDRVDGKTEYTVKNGKLTSDKDIPENSVVVLYNEGYEEYEQPATVKISDKDSCIYDKETVDVTLEAIGTDSSVYVLNDEKEKEFKSGDKVTIKHSDAKDGVVTLTLKGNTSSGETTYMKYYFTNSNDVFSARGKVEKGDKVTFIKPDNWSDKIFAYVYDGDGAEEKAWPGTEMKNLGDGKYEYTFEYEWEDSYIIFSDGENQYPEQGADGFTLDKDTEYKVD